MIFTEIAPQGGGDVLLLPLQHGRNASFAPPPSGERAHAIRPGVQTSFHESNGVISPDGRWLAYQSLASGQFEICVRPCPDVSGGQWQISTAGGMAPIWAHSRRELFTL